MSAILSIREASPSDADALSLLFERAEAPCHCRYWHFSGDKNDWQLRCALEPAKNSDEFRGALAAQSSEASGVVACVQDEVVGWLKLTPSTAMSKLYEQRLYRNLPCFERPADGVYTIGCMLVAPDWRGKGVARRLLQGAIEQALARGARVIEAFPRRGECLNPSELWLGPYSLYAELGFKVAHDFGPYPVLRLELSSRT
jgi:GNAT superfamily N-acetyltransferase